MVASGRQLDTHPTPSHATRQWTTWLHGNIVPIIQTLVTLPGSVTVPNHENSIPTSPEELTFRLSSTWFCVPCPSCWQTTKLHVSCALLKTWPDSERQVWQYRLREPFGHMNTFTGDSLPFSPESFSIGIWWPGLMNRLYTLVYSHTWVQLTYTHNSCTCVWLYITVCYYPHLRANYAHI